MYIKTCRIFSVLFKDDSTAVDRFTKQIFLQEINTLFTSLNLNNKNKTYYLIAGDFNARHTELGNRTTKSRGRWLINWKKENSVNYGTKIYPPCESKFTPTQSILDICIACARLKFINLKNNKFGTLSYDSDHKAIIMVIDLQDISWKTKQEETINTPIFKKTNWKKFTKALNDNYTLEIPNYRKLELQEINGFISKISDHINETIEKIVSKSTFKSNNNYYTTHKIENLHRKKSFLLTKLHQTQKTDPHNKGLMNNIKQLIEDTRNKIQNEIKTNMENHREKICKKINYRDRTKFFPIINKVFRPHERKDVPNLNIKEWDTHLRDRFSINKEKLSKVNSEYIIEDEIN